jgi:hypothetical protein
MLYLNCSTAARKAASKAQQHVKHTSKATVDVSALDGVHLEETSDALLLVLNSVKHARGLLQHTCL